MMWTFENGKNLQISMREDNVNFKGTQIRKNTIRKEAKI